MTLLSICTEVFITFFIFLLFFGVFTVLETEWPAERGHSRADRMRNIKHVFIYLFLGTIVAQAALQFIVFEPRETIPDNVFLYIGMLFVAIFLGDVIFYWYHRFEHTSKWLWPIHELHHSDEHLNVTTSYRTYFLELPLKALFISVPLSFIVGDIATNAIAIFFISIVWEFFTHANLRLQLGWLSPVFTGPQMHRIHHSRLPEHKDKNFAQYFPCIDMMFGTYYRPQKGEFPVTGTPGLRSDAAVAKIMRKPFVDWWRLLFPTRN